MLSMDTMLAASGLVIKPHIAYFFRDTGRMAKPMSTAEIFARNLALLMKAKSFRHLRSQNKLAQHSKVAQTTIGRVLRGEQEPTLQLIERLIRPFEILPWQALVPDFDPDDLPVTKQVDLQQRQLLERFKIVAEEVAHYQLDPKK